MKIASLLYLLNLIIVICKQKSIGIEPFKKTLSQTAH